MSGVTGLRYEALYPLLDKAAEDDTHWRDLFEDVRVLESAALDEMRSQTNG